MKLVKCNDVTFTLTLTPQEQADLRALFSGIVNTEKLRALLRGGCPRPGDSVAPAMSSDVVFCAQRLEALSGTLWLELDMAKWPR